MKEHLKDKYLICIDSDGCAIGYSRERTMMIGDALGDHQAAVNNGVFYPILASKESTSWLALRQQYLNLFLKDGFNNETQEALLLKMKENLQ